MRSFPDLAQRSEERDPPDARGSQEPPVSGVPGCRPSLRRALCSPGQGHGAGLGQDGGLAAPEGGGHQQIYQVRHGPSMFSLLVIYYVNIDISADVKIQSHRTKVLLVCSL